MCFREGGLGNTLVRPEVNIDDMDIVVATEALKRHILSLVPVSDGRLLSVAPRAGDDIYLAVPHPSDPVLETNERRVIEFLRTTFFDNASALECQLAAVCLTLRGSNIVRAFVTLCPGGVGQSRNTALIAKVFGDMHGFIDMNVFYTEDELRKQADTCTGKVRM